LRGDTALRYFCSVAKGTVLDVGSGQGEQAAYLRSKGFEVVTLDDKHEADIRGSFVDIDIRPFTAIHCSHTLEHARNPGQFLDKLFATLEDGGHLCLTVPPLKHEIVGGHVTLWNAGLLVYNLILAGFDCSTAWVKSYGYNVSVVVQKKPRPDVEVTMSAGDIEKLRPYFPWPDVRQGFDGRR
jgi:SAM-dependent methyltransferase